MNPDETAHFWLAYAHDDLASRCAALHEMRRRDAEARSAEENTVVRRTLGQVFIRGYGIEVGAGSRPFPIPTSATCFYGDVRNRPELEKYFNTDAVAVSGHIDAQSLDQIREESLDFAISAHVIEHLFDPIGAMKQTIRRLKVGGVFILVAPEMTQTWDRRRPETTLKHLIEDEKDGGESTGLQAYLEHCQFVHPELTGETLSPEEIHRRAQHGLANRLDVHVHAWTESGFFELVSHVAKEMLCQIEARLTAVNENLYVLRRVRQS